MTIGRPSREVVYERLEAAVEGLKTVGGLPLPDEAREIWKGIWHEEAHHSTAMEGNTLILREVQLLLDRGQAVGSKEMKAYLEVQGYGRAAEWVYTQAVKVPPGQQGHVTLNEVREIHKLALEPVWLQFPPKQLDPKEGPGAYRRKKIEPFSSGMEPPPWPDVPAAMTDWVDSANDWGAAPLGCHDMERFAELHASFERIHPFRDGNGRVGRLVLNLLLVRFGYPPAVIEKEVREKYLKALLRADEKENGPLGEILARAINRSIDRFILPALAGPHKMIPISALAGAKGLSHNALTLAAQRGRLQAIKQGGQWYSTKKAVQVYGESRYRRKPKDSQDRPEPDDSGAMPLFN